MKENLIVNGDPEGAICPTGQGNGISAKEVWFVDRIVFSVSSWYISGASPEDFKRTFRPNFSPTMRKKSDSAYRRTFLSRKQIRSSFLLTASYHPDEQLIAVTMRIVLNGNRLLRMDLQPGSETKARGEGLDGKDNWITIPRDFEHAIRLQKRQVFLIVSELNSITSSIRSSITETLQSSSLCLGVQSISLASVELNHDFETRDSLAFVASQAAEFGRVHKSGTQRQYPIRSSSSRIRNSLCLSGKISKGYQEKLYSKTRTTTRHEYCIGAHRIQKLLGSNVISRPHLDQFSKMTNELERCVEKSQSRFGTPVLVALASELLIDVIHKIAHNVSDREQFLILISLYSVDGIVRPTAANEGIVEKLHRKKILDRTSRGVYCFAGWNQSKADALRSVCL